MHEKLAIRVAVLSIAGLSGIAFMPPEVSRHPELFGLCFILGTMYAQVTIAAAWMAFGPYRLLWRFPLSLSAVLIVVVAFGFNVAQSPGPGQGLSVFLGGCFLAQWFIAQLPLWALGVAYGLRLRHPDNLADPTDRRDLQFGIRELLIFTTIIAVILGIGRLLLPSLAGAFASNGEVPIFIFLAVAGTLLSLPLLVAGLLPRYAGRATAIVLLVIALATAAETPLLSSFVPPLRGPQPIHFILINTFTAAWILVYVYVIRRAGYCLGGAGERDVQAA